MHEWLESWDITMNSPAPAPSHTVTSDGFCARIPMCWWLGDDCCCSGKSRGYTWWLWVSAFCCWGVGRSNHTHLNEIEGDFRASAVDGGVDVKVILLNLFIFVTPLLTWISSICTTKGWNTPESTSFSTCDTWMPCAENPLELKQQGGY